ncbi:MAG: NTP transferase domain-containing protein [Chloroflexi bacterium]|nr:NTP transferase domain-containing protein [Chloroflexota bacterium]
MDHIDKKLLFVFDGDKYVNIVSIGDIQRAIIRNESLTKAISTILRPNTRTARENQPVSEIKRKMLDSRIECMPIIDDAGDLVDVLFWDDLLEPQEQPQSKLNLPVVIMAGGKGTRLKPITNVLPKPLIPIGDKTIIEHIIERFLKVGCDHFYISVNYKAELIKYYLHQLKLPGCHVDYIHENQPLGTAGSLSLLQADMDTPFFLTNCDILVNERYEEIVAYHQAEHNELTLVAALKHFQLPYGTVDSGSGGELIQLNEKPEITFKINAGLYLIEPHLLKEIPENKFFHMTHLIEKIILRNGKIGVFPISEGSWQDIGEWKTYLNNNQVILH